MGGGGALKPPLTLGFFFLMQGITLQSKRLVGAIVAMAEMMSMINSVFVLQIRDCCETAWMIHLQTLLLLHCTQQAWD